MKEPSRATKSQAEIKLASRDLREDMAFFTETLGFRLETIFPADDPSVAVLSGHGMRLRLSRGACHAPVTIRILCEDPNGFADGVLALTAPNGTCIEIAKLNPPMELPTTQHDFVVRRLADQAPWVIGRAGMHYRDLIPNRLGGSIIASHIRIPDGGPVPDMVHYHTVGFQLIFCYRGWVDLVYEDQGPPFRLYAGDCVIQPPEIRHRVLVASDNVEVIEIGVPAEHITTIDHDMELPNPTINRARKFRGQRFVHHREAEADWGDWRLPGWTYRETTIGQGTGGVAGVHVARPHDASKTTYSHDTDILFTFVMEGQMTLSAKGHPDQMLNPGDAFVVPPHMKVSYCDLNENLQLLEVALPAIFDTKHG